MALETADAFRVLAVIRPVVEDRFAQFLHVVDVPRPPVKNPERPVRLAHRTGEHEEIAPVMGEITDPQAAQIEEMRDRRMLRDPQPVCVIGTSITTAILSTIGPRSPKNGPRFLC